MNENLAVDINNKNNDYYKTHTLRAIRANSEFAYLADEWITDYYSVQTSFLNACKATIFACHNETVNVWIHALGGLYFLWNGVVIAIRATTSSSPYLAVYCFTAWVCFFSSALSHIVVGLGKEKYDRFSRVDYAGISFQLWGSVMALNQVALVQAEYIHLLTSSITLCTTATLATLMFTIIPELSKVKSLRVGVYSTAACSAFIPLYSARNEPHVANYIEHVLPWMIVVYLIGIFFYVSRYPERLHPAKFDRFLSSHNFWHFFVWLGSYLHFHGLIQMDQEFISKNI